MKLSIIVPVYNGEKKIEDCLSSIFNQEDISDIELEIIVVNDGSTDNTFEILKKYSSEITIISTPNGGVASARNKGLQAVSGDFVMFLDSDDMLDRRCLCEVTAIQKKTDADIVRFSYKIVYDGGASSLPPVRFREEKLVLKADFEKDIYKNYITGIKLNSICMTLFKASLLKGLEFRKDMLTAEDALFSMQAYTKASKVYILPRPYYLYYQVDTSLTGHGLSLAQKYRCNFILASEILKTLPTWGMNTPYYYIRTILKPVFLTFDKLNRIISEKIIAGGRK